MSIQSSLPCHAVPVLPTLGARPRLGQHPMPGIDAHGRVDRPTRPTRSRRGVRLTRPGQVVVVTALLCLVLAMWSWWGSPTAASGHAHHPATHSIVVKPGQTLWDIAGKIAPGKDPREVVAQIEDLNSMSDPGELIAGQPLFVPSYH
jgi:nucleoid-associated protein YgaU